MILSIAIACGCFLLVFYLKAKGSEIQQIIPTLDQCQSIDREYLDNDELKDEHGHGGSGVYQEQAKNEYEKRKEHMMDLRDNFFFGASIDAHVHPVLPCYCTLRDRYSTIALPEGDRSMEAECNVVKDLKNMSFWMSGITGLVLWLINYCLRFILIKFIKILGYGTNT